jgi:hypothetical protein
MTVKDKLAIKGDPPKDEPNIGNRKQIYKIFEYKDKE